MSDDRTTLHRDRRHAERTRQVPVGTQEPIPDPACPRTSGVRRTSTRRRRSAPSARSPRLFVLAILGAIGFVASYVVFKVGDDH